MQRWTDKEIATLTKYYPTLGLKKTAELLNRPEPSVRMKASRLKLKSGLVGKHNLVEEDILVSRLKDSEYELISGYSRINTKAVYRHKSCGHEWQVSYNNLLKMAGCPNCSSTGNKTESRFVYLCHFEALGLHKIGITNSWDKRKYNFGAKPTLITLVECETNELALELEELVLSEVDLYNSGELANGNTETFLWAS
jgi:hypothetical protein